MKRHDEERVSTQNAFFAAKDCMERNKENMLQYTLEEHAIAEELKKDVEEVFYRRNVYLNYNKNDIVIKVNRPTVGDTLGDSAKSYRKLTKKLEELNVTSKKLKNGNLIFHLPRFSDDED